MEHGRCRRLGIAEEWSDPLIDLGRGPATLLEDVEDLPIATSQLFLPQCGVEAFIDEAVDGIASLLVFTAELHRGAAQAAMTALLARIGPRLNTARQPPEGSASR